MGERERHGHDGKISAMGAHSAAGAKNELRQQLIQARNLRHISKDETVDVGLTQNLKQVCIDNRVRTVAAYLSFGTEPSTRGFLGWAELQGITVLLPISIADGSLTWVRSAGEETASGIFGFEEAVGELADFSTAELALVPALAVDGTGNRLGKGKGFYDRALAESARMPTFAVVYDSEVFDEIPAEPHDFRVDGYVTETKIVSLEH
jgi:5-formyltetrahydrofolate cyclo-ligase